MFLIQTQPILLAKMHNKLYLCIVVEAKLASNKNCDDEPIDHTLVLSNALSVSFSTVESGR